MKILKRLNPETAHNLAILCAKTAGKSSNVTSIITQKCHVDDQSLRVKMGNLTFPNPIGLAAGYDKNGEIIRILKALGFGFIEIGTVTPLPQEGNEKPRLFRLPEDLALINRMGFNNKGLNRMIKTINYYW